MHGTSWRRLVRDDADGYVHSVLRILRAGLLTFVILSLALAGPVQANCAPPSADAAVPCSSMISDEDGPDQPRPEKPAKACAIIQCPTAPPAIAAPATRIGAPTLHVIRPAMSAVRTMVSSNRAPEQRPPIS
jgi:hypothetical protein